MWVQLLSKGRGKVQDSTSSKFALGEMGPLDVYNVTCPSQHSKILVLLHGHEALIIETIGFHFYVEYIGVELF